MSRVYKGHATCPGRLRRKRVSTWPYIRAALLGRGTAAWQRPTHRVKPPSEGNTRGRPADCAVQKR